MPSKGRKELLLRVMSLAEFYFLSNIFFRLTRIYYHFNFSLIITFYAFTSHAN